MLKLLNAIGSWACVNPDCGQIGTCHTALNPLKADLPAAWLQGISLRMSQQEKPSGLARGSREIAAANPKAPFTLSARQNGHKPTEGIQSTYKMLLLMSLIKNIG